MTKAPPLRDDCFVMPRGVHWTPVDEALEKLHQSLKKMKNTSIIPVNKGFGRVLAEDVLAATNHPPFANSAVDGYGFALDTISSKSEIALELISGRSAAGSPFSGKVPDGTAVRV
ncbi:molybdopterin molybdenumtransferase MoeA, partial [Amylibacter sp.]|nr:molybdopterin molybdenumtransferase MoeA [Amylibacter sp.]